MNDKRFYMWEELKLTIKHSNYVIYKDNAPDAESWVKEVMFSVSNVGYFECIIIFTSSDFANQFFDMFTELCPVYIHNPYSDRSGCVSYRDEELGLNCIKFDLSQQKESDLKRMHEAFRLAMPQEAWTIIKFRPRQLSDLEKIFYDMLPNVNSDNFATLLEMATNIVTGHNANAFWELAQSCKNAHVPLIEEWLKTLKCINMHTNYHSKASEELAYFILADHDDENPISIEQQRTWLTNGLLYSTGMEHGREELLKKIILTFLGESWLEEEKIFPTKTYKNDVERAFSYHVDLLMYTKFLHEENTKLRKEQQLNLVQKNLETSTKLKL